MSETSSKARPGDLPRDLHQLSVEEKRALAKRLLRQRSQEARQPFAMVAEEDRGKLPEGVDDAYPLSRLQAGMLFHSEFGEGQLGEGSALYHDQHTIHLRGPLQPDGFRTALRQASRRHPLLRTSFDLSSFSEPLQLVHREVEIPLEVEDIRSVAPEEQDAVLERWLADDRRIPFAPARAPLCRCRIHRRGEDRFQFTLSFHHAILDGWSVVSLLIELFHRYLHALGAIPGGGAGGLDEQPLRTTYRDFIRLEQELVASKPARELWRRQLEGATQSPLTRSAEGPLGDGEARGGLQVLPLSIPPPVGARLGELARAWGIPLKNLFMAVHLRALSAASGQVDVVTGWVTHGRPEKADGDKVLGLFLNTLPFRLRLDGGSWKSLAEEVFGLEQELMPVRRYPLAELQKMQGGAPLFDSAFNFRNYHIYQGVQGFSELEIVDHWDFDETNIGLIANFYQDVDSGEPSLALCYLDRVFASDEIARWGGYYLRALEAFAQDPQADYRAGSLLSAAERQQLLFEWNDTATSFGPARTLHRIIEATARQHPERPAVRFEGDDLSYGELDREADLLAGRLRALSVGPEVPVAVCLERSRELIVALLGILKAGGAYVPLDPSYPGDRLLFMLRDSGAPVLVTGNGAVPFSVPEPVQQVPLGPRLFEELEAEGSSGREEALGQDASPDSLAYMIYTSGSTGRPKGVMNSHRGIVNRLLWMQHAYGLTTADRVLQKTPMSFDVSVWEFFWPLMTGACLVVARPEGHRDSRYLADLIAEEAVTTLHFVPSMLRAFLDEPDLGRCSCLERVICSGEALPFDLQQRFYQRLDAGLHNLYGPTEAAVDVTYWACPRRAEDPAVPIGRPIANLRTHVLGTEMEPLPIGAAGELHLGGAGLARGYVGRPALTAERFIPNPLGAAPGERLYRTGDLARYRPEGTLEFLGRLDHQVKIRGTRIELGEIDAALVAHPGIHQGVTVARREEDGRSRLVAYCVPAPAAAPAVAGEADPKEETAEPARPSVAELRSFLGRTLIDAMVPSSFVFLDALPLTANGKLDRGALPAPTRDRSASDQAYVAPRNLREEILAQVWRGALGIDRVGVDDNFFELGGDSILSLRVRARAHQQGLRFALRDLFEHPTIARLAEHLDSGESPLEETAPAPPFGLLSAADRERLVEGTAEELEDAYPLARLQAGMLFHGTFGPQSATYHNILSYHLRAPLDLAALRRALDGVMARHPVLRTSFDLSRFGEPVQLVASKAAARVEVCDLGALPAEQQERALAVWFEGEKTRSFDTGSAPLFRLVLHRRGAESFQLSFSFHHAILDGWSVAVLLTELFRAYFEDGGGESLEPPPRATFANFVALERATQQKEASREFWRRSLDAEAVGLLPHRLPAQRRAGSDGGDQRRRGRQHTVAFPPQVWSGLRHLASTLGVPVKSVLLAAHGKVLSRVMGVEDILTGLVSNSRSEELDGDRVLGLFINTLPLRLCLGDGSWSRLVQEVFEAEKRMLPHRRFPLAELQKQLGKRAFFETMFNFVHFHIYEPLAGLTQVEVLDATFFEETNYTLAANFQAGSGASPLELNLAYDASEIPREQALAIAGYYDRALRSMAAKPQAPHQSEDFLTAAQRHQVTVEWNDTTRRRAPRLVHQRIAEQASRRPDATAVVFEQQRLSYRQLEDRAQALARRLRRLGVGPEMRVGVFMENSLELVVSLLGILHAGAAYVPIDPSFPEDRLSWMLGSSELRALIAEDSSRAAELVGEDLPILRPGEGEASGGDASVGAAEAEPGGQVRPESAAYMIYTSGSTGRPKGVVVPHGALANFLASMARRPGLTHRDTVLSVTTLSFDISALEIFLPLIAGATVELVPRRVSAVGTRLAEALEESGATFMQATPATWKVLLDAGWPGDKTLTLLCGGEALAPELAQRLLERCGGLWNMYGPTETTVWSAVHRVEATDMPMPIGRPIDNTSIHLLDRQGMNVPPGLVGELLIGGDGVARGYRRRPGLTAERFRPDPFSPVPGRRLYRTGDLARRFPDGRLECLGRIDQQVKIRGFRIEPGEVEAALQQHPALREAVVVARPGDAGSHQLVAYAVSEEQPPPSVSELRQALLETLPAYMVPTIYVFLDSLPLLPNGKLDRRSLPAPDSQRPNLEQPYVAPRGPREEKLAEIWQQVLGRDRVGVHDNFFDLGGDSVLSLQIVARANDAGLRLAPEQVFEHPTIAELVSVAPQGEHPSPADASAGSASDSATDSTTDSATDSAADTSLTGLDPEDLDQFLDAIDS